MTVVKGSLSDFISTGAFSTVQVAADSQPSAETPANKMMRSAASVMETVQTRVLQLMGADKDKLRWVIKATSLTPGPAKLKYLRYLVVDAWETRSGGALVTYLPKRPLRTDPAVAVKGEMAMIICTSLMLPLMKHGAHCIVCRLCGADEAVAPRPTGSPASIVA